MGFSKLSNLNAFEIWFQLTQFALQILLQRINHTKLSIQTKEQHTSACAISTWSCWNKAQFASQDFCDKTMKVSLENEYILASANSPAAWPRSSWTVRRSFRTVSELRFSIVLSVLKRKCKQEPILHQMVVAEHTFHCTVAILSWVFVCCSWTCGCVEGRGTVDALAQVLVHVVPWLPGIRALAAPSCAPAILFSCYLLSCSFPVSK